MEMGSVFFQRARENQKVIKVGEWKDIQEVSPYSINESLEDSRGIGQPKENHKVFLVARRCRDVFHLSPSQI